MWINNFRTKKMGFTFNDWGTQPDPHLLYYATSAKRRKVPTSELENAKPTRSSTKVEARPIQAQGRLRRSKLVAEEVPTIALFSADNVTVRSEAVQNYVQHGAGWYRACPGVAEEVSAVSPAVLASSPGEPRRRTPSTPPSHRNRTPCDSLSCSAPRRVTLTALLASLLVFLIVRQVPGDVVAQMLGQTATVAEQAMRRFFGIDEPSISIRQMDRRRSHG